jgi:hypothetical protein
LRPRSRGGVAARWETANRFTVYRTCPLATPEDR